MNAHLGAIRDDLSGLSYTTWLYWAPIVSGQYLVLTGKAWDRPEEIPVCGLSDTLDTEFRVKAVAGTPDGVVIMLSRIRGVLSPGLGEHRVLLVGRIVSTRFVRSEFVDVDQDTVIAGTNRHPAVGVDTYRLISEPA